MDSLCSGLREKHEGWNDGFLSGRTHFCLLVVV